MKGLETVSSLLREQVPTVIMTGAGISVESGIPTFRGEEGYWREGSAVYTPMEMATYSMFSTAPERVWAWYRMRLGVCQSAEPNTGHAAVRTLGERFQSLSLVTQNVDGLHQQPVFGRVLPHPRQYRSNEMFPRMPWVHKRQTGTRITGHPRRFHVQ